MASEGISIVHDQDKRFVSIKCKRFGLDCVLSEAKFAQITIKHLRTGKKMSDLLKEWQGGK